MKAIETSEANKKMLPTASWRQSGVLPNALDLLPSSRPASRWTGKRRDERLGHLDETRSNR